MFVSGERKDTAHVLHTYVKTPFFRLPANLLNITTLLQGDPNISNNMNSLIFKAVQAFFGRFAME